jgi:hypothetical protein
MTTAHVTIASCVFKRLFEPQTSVVPLSQLEEKLAQETQDEYNRILVSVKRCSPSGGEDMPDWDLNHILLSLGTIGSYQSNALLLNFGKPLHLRPVYVHCTSMYSIN